MDVRAYVKAFTESQPFMSHSNRLQPRLTQLNFNIFIWNQLNANAELEKIELNFFEPVKIWVEL